MKLKDKAFASITHGDRLLVFRHPDVPETGLAGLGIVATDVGLAVAPYDECVMGLDGATVDHSVVVHRGDVPVDRHAVFSGSSWVDGVAGAGVVSLGRLAVDNLAGAIAKFDQQFLDVLGQTRGGRQIHLLIGSHFAVAEHQSTIESRQMATSPSTCSVPVRHDRVVGACGKILPPSA
jgi:hypothetical protein